MAEIARDELEALLDTKKHLEAKSRVIQAAWRIFLRNGHKGPQRGWPEKYARFETMKQTVYDELRNIMLLIETFQSED